MLDQFRRRVSVAITAVSLAAVLQAQEPKWVDRAEYDLVQEIGKTTAPAEKVKLLSTWKEKYPNTEFKTHRLTMFIDAYRAAGQLPRAFDSAKELIALDAKNLAGLYWATSLTIALNSTSEDILSTGEKASQGLLSNIETLFAVDKKPQAVSDADWKKQRVDIEALAHTTLGWIAKSRKNLEGAEKGFVKALELSPGSAQVSYWLGEVVLQQRKPETQSQAFFHFARAGAYDGAGSWDATRRQQVMAYVEKTYKGFHGSEEGLKELIALAKSNVMPPAGFKIESAAEIAAKNEEKFKEENPALALWMSIKKELTGPNGGQYWDDKMKGAGLPGGANNVTKFRGRVVSHKPAIRPKEVVVAISDSDTPEVTLKIDEDGFLPGKADPGTEIAFEGTATAFIRQPFMVTFEVEKDKVSGWPKPEPAKPVAKKKATAKKS